MRIIGSWMVFCISLRLPRSALPAPSQSRDHRQQAQEDAYLHAQGGGATHGCIDALLLHLVLAGHGNLCPSWLLFLVAGRRNRSGTYRLFCCSPVTLLVIVLPSRRNPTRRREVQRLVIGIPALSRGRRVWGAAARGGSIRRRRTLVVPVRLLKVGGWHVLKARRRGRRRAMDDLRHHGSGRRLTLEVMGLVVLLMMRRRRHLLDDVQPRRRTMPWRRLHHLLHDLHPRRRGCKSSVGIRGRTLHPLCPRTNGPRSNDKGQARPSRTALRNSTPPDLKFF
jgi:hypothetical protein